MKRITTALLLLTTLTANAQYFHDVMEKQIPVEDLRTDVDFVRTTLKKKSANLYAYISEKDLDHKFDSLKLLLTPMTSVLFGAKLLTVLTSIGDGHMGLGVDNNRFTPTEVALARSHKVDPIYLFRYIILDGHIYIADNHSPNKTIVLGTEVLSIDHKPAAQIVAALMKHVPSDGYNTTFKYYLLNYYGSVGSTYYTINGYRDSSVFELKYKDAVHSFMFHSFLQDTTKQVAPVATAPSPSVDWKAMSGNSSVYWVGLRTFGDAYKITETYDKIFKELKQAKAKTLVLDLRGNMGGANVLGATFLSYLIDTPFYIYKRPFALPKKDTVLSKRTIQEYKWMEKLYQAESYIKPRANSFKGKLYVLINGGTFSCASMLAAGLKAHISCIFVGQETGGSNSIWTGASKFVKVNLQASKLVLHFGDQSFQSVIDLKPFGRGVMPDVPITYTMNDYVAGKDLEMEWVLKDIAKGTHSN